MPGKLVKIDIPRPKYFADDSFVGYFNVKGGKFVDVNGLKIQFLRISMKAHPLFKLNLIMGSLMILHAMIIIIGPSFYPICIHQVSNCSAANGNNSCGYRHITYHDLLWLQVDKFQVEPGACITLQIIPHQVNKYQETIVQV